MAIRKHIFIVSMLLLLAVMIIMLAQSAVAERNGEDSEPPEHDDWIIDSPGNFISNETDWFEVIENEPPAEPTVIEHYDHIKLDGNIIIRSGGELTLMNTTLNMTDNSGYYIIIEEGGSLIMEVGPDALNSSTRIHNGNGGYIGYFKLEGNLSMNMSSLDRVGVMYVNSSTPNLLLKDVYITARDHVQIKDQVLNFTSVSISSDTGTALYLDNCSAEFNQVYISTRSNTTELDTLSVKDSWINATRGSITSSSDFNSALYLESSWFNATDHPRFYSSGTAIPIYARSGSYLHLDDNYKFGSKGEILLYAEDSTIILGKGEIGYDTWFVKTFVGGFRFDGCDVTLDDIEFFKIRANAVFAEDSDVTISNCTLWNVTEDAILIEHGTLQLENTNFYNITGSAVNLLDVQGTIINVTMDEDDRNWTTGRPYPPIYSGWGYGIEGYGVQVTESDVDIIGTTFAAHEMDAIHAMDSTVDITGCTFRPTGWLDTNDVHGIYMENSTGQIIMNEFNTPYRGDGFDLFALNMVPMDMDEFTEKNNFSEGRTVRVEFTLYVQVVNELAGGVTDADVNLTNGFGENTKLTSTIVGGWVRSPFTVPAYEIFRYTEYNNQTNETEESFSNKTYNDYRLTVFKEYKAYNFTVTRSRNVNISRTMNLQIQLNVSSPELSIKSAGIYPRVLQGEEIEITVVIRNFGEGWANNLNISYYYAINGTHDWVWFGSNNLNVPGLYGGGNNTMHSVLVPINAPLGDYSFMIKLDPEDLFIERDETNNDFIIEDAFGVLSRPRVVIEFPMGDDMIEGIYAISGYAEDDYDNDLSLEMHIDGMAVSVTDLTNTGEILLWSFNWDTTVYDVTQGTDKYQNGEHIISTRVSNNNPTGYDESEWVNITVVVANAPALEWFHPIQDEFINETWSIPLYNVEIKVLARHDLINVRLKIDDGEWMSMSNLGTHYKLTLDTKNFMDGDHTLTYNATYGYGFVTDSISVLMNSPNENTLPVLDFSYTLTEKGLTVTGNAVDDHKIEWVRIRLDEGPWLPLNESTGNVSEYYHFWGRSQLTPDSHKITVKAFDGFDSVPLVKWFVVDLFYDLTIVDITSPVSVTEGDWVNFTLLIRNTGPYSSPSVAIDLSIGSISRVVSNIVLGPNSQQIVQIAWHATEGNHTIGAVVNPSQKNEETDPNNNEIIDENLVVAKVVGEDPGDETDMSAMLLAALAIMVVLGIIIAVITVSGRKRGPEKQ